MDLRHRPEQPPEEEQIADADTLPDKMTLSCGKLTERAAPSGRARAHARIKIWIEVAWSCSRVAASGELFDECRDRFGQVAEGDGRRHACGDGERDWPPLHERARNSAGGGVETFAGEYEFHMPIPVGRCRLKLWPDVISVSGR
ncbi:hypothetical protein D9M71_504350 [compost metagenome]